MCAIAGIFDKSGELGPARIAQVAKQAADQMSYRGPDDCGLWSSPDGRCAFAHRRLAILDTSFAGHQPMVAADRLSVIVFNGEIYNFIELRGELQTKGEVFRSRSDTEVLLSLLNRERDDALPRLDGMFAFAYYDVRSRELILARDMFGEKPLFYVDTDKYFAFASELHALTHLPGFDVGINRETIASYLSQQYVPAPNTIYSAARKLQPGSYLKFRLGTKTEVNRHFQFRTSMEYSLDRSLDDLADELEAILIRSVQRRLISDVPLGAFLSGGVDSSTIAAIAVKAIGAPLQTFSIGFEGHADSEHLDASEIARTLGTEHRDQVLTSDVVELGRRIGAMLDEPNADSSCLPTFLLCGFARTKVTVALSGDGGDEMFGGYGRYFVTVDEQQKYSGMPIFGNWRAGEAYWSSRILVYPDDELRQLLGEIPRAYAHQLALMRRVLDEDQRPLINVLRETDVHNYLPGAVLAKVDRMSMQHSLEVRAPLIGKEVAEFAMRLGAEECYQNGNGKRVLKRMASRYLPESWMNRPKRGFGLPMDAWSANKLLPATRSLVLSRDSRLPAWIERERLINYLDKLERHFNAYRVWSLYILESWLRAHPCVPIEGFRTTRLTRRGIRNVLSHLTPPWPAARRSRLD